MSIAFAILPFYCVKSSADCASPRSPLQTIKLFSAGHEMSVADKLISIFLCVVENSTKSNCYSQLYNTQEEWKTIFSDVLI